MKLAKALFMWPDCTSTCLRKYHSTIELQGDFNTVPSQTSSDCKKAARKGAQFGSSQVAHRCNQVRASAQR
eukprot:324927-Amphidinium_carterae.1